MYVTDLDGNQDFCRTQIILQDNQDVCPDVASFGTLAGAIKGYNNNPSPSVTVTIQSIGNLSKNQATNNQGVYAFNDLRMYQTYEISSAYDQDALNGVSTKDIVKIQRHILGIELFNNPYKLIAADVNKTGSITASDISELRRLILGIQTKFEKNKPWNFVDANYPLNSDNYANFPTKIEIGDFNQSLSNNDFIAVKTGDVTGEANTGFGSGLTGRNKHQAILEIDQVKYTAGQVAKIPVKYVGEKLNISGMQLAFHLDESYFEFIGMENGILNIQSGENYHFADGSVRISWNSDEDLSTNSSDIIAYIVCKVKSYVLINASNLNLDIKSLNSEIYVAHEDLGISLIYRTQDANTAGGFELYQNVPNPFYGETTIFFNVPKESFVKLALYDLSGKAIKAFELQAKKGINSVIVKTDDLYSSGVLYYRLEADEYSSTKKMIILK
jgi:hypothetical protein